MQTTVIIVAGGSGMRMGEPQPKQFLPLAGKAVLQHTLEKFHSVDPTFKYMVVLPPAYIDYWKNHCVIKKFIIPHEIVEGGEERFYSVRNAVERLPSQGICLIHDGVRPLVSKLVIKHVLRMAQNEGAAVPAIPLTDSIRKVENGISHSISRKSIFRIQTPQGFANRIIKEAYRQPYTDLFSDDASVVESIGHAIHLVEGNPENIKITTAADMILSEFYLSKVH